VLDYGVLLSSLVKQEVDSLPRGLTSVFTLRQQSSTHYHSLPVSSVLRAAVDHLRLTGRNGSHAFDYVACPTSLTVCHLFP